MKFDEWKDFKGGEWTHEINVRNFIQTNYTPYTGNSDFLASATDSTKSLWNIVLDLYKKEKDNGGVLEIDTDTPSSITSHEARIY